MVMQLYEKQDVYFRYYQKLQILAANIGGVANAILMISNFVVNFISSQLLIVDLANKLIKFDDERLPSKCQNTNTLNNLKQSEVKIYVFEKHGKVNNINTPGKSNVKLK
jgi:hypothetical protein